MIALKNKQALLWGTLHGLNDFAAGFMLANYTLTHNNNDAFLFIVIYSIIGFGGQLPVGFWLDHKKQVKPFASASLILLPLAVMAYFVSAEAGIILSGFASAFVHVTGGAVCLQANENKTGPLALFTAPGVLGLTLGGMLGHYGNWQLAVIGVLILPVAYLILKNTSPSYKNDFISQSPKNPLRGAGGLDSHDLLMLSILLIMCFRSFIFDVINQVAHDFDHGILIIGISAFAGKIIGGFVADKIGWKKFVYISLPLALLLFQFGKENIYALAFGIACLQSSVPITLLLMGRSLPQYPATATALSLGTSIALAGLPLYMMPGQKLLNNFFSNPVTTAAAFIFLLLCWFFVDRLFFYKKITSPVST
jgi:FSR family fosmidomycin resistance protein-like MFS transporter